MESMIEACCKQLKIGSTFYKGYKEIKVDTHEQFLLELLKKELENREVVRKNRLLKSANFDERIEGKALLHQCHQPVDRFSHVRMPAA
jgi:hypothetical protein